MRPARDDVSLALLTSCLTLVKPVGMSAQDTGAWLAVAAEEIAHLPEAVLTSACTVARRTCTHHGQIVPTILREAEPDLARLRRIAELDAERDAPSLSAPEPWKPTADELERIKSEAAANLKASR